MGRTAWLTGGTGFVGQNLVRALVARGWQVTVSHRASSNLEGVNDTGAALVVADVTDAKAVLRAMPERPDAVFHLAANLSFSRREADQQTAVNVAGTRHVVEAALARQARRFVHLSSVAAWGPADGDTVNEHSSINEAQHWVNYSRTKWLAETEVDAGVARGLDAVILNPSHILGPRDRHNWARLFLTARDQRFIGAPETSAPWCHVRDVVEALVRATECGASGQRYLLGGAQASYREVLALICQKLGRPPPMRLPPWSLRLGAAVASGASRLTGRPPSLTPELAHVWSTSFSIDDTSARRQLGYQSSSLHVAVTDTYEWLHGRRMLPAGRPLTNME